MSTTSIILNLLKGYAAKHGNAAVSYSDFCQHVHQYALKHSEDQPDSVIFLGTSNEPIDKELERLATDRSIFIQQGNSPKRLIFVTPYFIDKYTSRYNELETNPSLPFPSAHELPKHCPVDLLFKDSLSEIMFKLLEHPPREDNKVLYGLTMPMDMPTMIFPSTVSVHKLLKIAGLKISLMLQKGEHHEYFLKKLKVSNPGKELSIKNFFTQFVQNPDEAIQSLEESGDTYYYFTQMCFFIKKDYEKVKDFTQEDINILQSVSILEILSNFYKMTAQNKQKKETALRSLEQQLEKAPFYFSFDQLIKFTDGKGVPLLGQYTEEELKEHLHKISTETDAGRLPRLLIFKTRNNGRYFIMKNRVMQLILRLCTDARATIKAVISKEWSASLKNFTRLPEMTDQASFEKRLEIAIDDASPILTALLQAQFLQIVYMESSEETQGRDSIPLFQNGLLVPYSTLLSLNRGELLSSTRIMLPFWYTTPIISFFAALLLKKPNTRRKRSAFEKEMESGEKRIASAEEELAKKDPVMAKKLELRKGAATLEGELVPAGSTLEREMASYCHQWNKKLGEARDNLTADVQALVRDHFRKVLRGISGDGFTRERIANIAETLVATPTLQKITKDSASLDMYIQLYLIQLVKGIK